MSIIESRRLGIFRASLSFINSAPAAARAVMAQVIVLKAEIRVESDEIEYVALCDEFAEVPLGNVLPRYIANIRKDVDGPIEFSGWSAT